MIAVLNHSTRMSNAEAAVATRAVYHQLRYHASPAWGIAPVAVVFYADETQVPPGAWKVIIFDNSDQAGAAGYHGVGPDGAPYARVFVAPFLDNGGSTLHTPLAVSTCLSHEVLEAFCDSFVNAWMDNGRGVLFAREVGDPVEADAYQVSDDNGSTAYVSNFVTPAWFNPWAPAGAKFDYLAKLTAPFSMTRHGYVITMKEGKVTYTFGEEYPEWKKATKTFDGARSARRAGFAASLAS